MNNIKKLSIENIDLIYKLETLNFGYDSLSYESIKNLILNITSFDLSFGYFIDNIVVAYCFIRKINDEYELLDICVDANYRNKNIGYTLLKYIIDNLNKNDKIFLEVRESNIYAIHLYEKIGFYKISNRLNYYKNPNENAIIYKFIKQ